MNKSLINKSILHLAPGSSRAIISHEKLLQTKSSEEGNDSASSVEKASSPKTNIESRKGHLSL